MDTVLYVLENILYYSASTISIIIEIIGLAMIVYTFVKAIINYKNKDHFNFLSMSKDPTINQGLSTALEILLAGEICKTLTVTYLGNLIIIAILVLIRLFMAFMLHWEGKHKCECEEDKIEEKKTKTIKKGKK